MNAFRLLCDVLPQKVGSLFSFNSLREDIGVAYATVRDWVFLAEALYFGFFIRPYSRAVKRSLQAAPKFYLYDILHLSPDSGARLENLTALHLLKACQFWTDRGDADFNLLFVRDKEKREVDFLITLDKEPWALIECKSNAKVPAANLSYFSKHLKTKRNYQLTTRANFDRYFKMSNIRIITYQKFFSGWV